MKVNVRIPCPHVSQLVLWAFWRTFSIFVQVLLAGVLFVFLFQLFFLALLAGVLDRRFDLRALLSERLWIFLSFRLDLRFCVACFFFYGRHCGVFSGAFRGRFCFLHSVGFCAGVFLRYLADVSTGILLFWNCSRRVSCVFALVFAGVFPRNSLRLFSLVFLCRQFCFFILCAISRTLARALARALLVAVVAGVLQALFCDCVSRRFCDPLTAQ